MFLYTYKISHQLTRDGDTVRMVRGPMKPTSRGIRITLPNPRMDPFPAPVVVVAVAAIAQMVVGFGAEVADRAAVAGTEIESAAAVEQTVVALDSSYDQAAKAAESGVVEKE